MREIPALRQGGFALEGFSAAINEISIDSFISQADIKCK
jgi:hypothetical protein